MIAQRSLPQKTKTDEPNSNLQRPSEPESCPELDHEHNQTNMPSGSKKEKPPISPPLTNESDDNGDQELSSETKKQNHKKTAKKKKRKTKTNRGAADAADEIKTKKEESRPPSFRLTESTRQALWDSENEAAPGETKRRKKTKARSGNRDSTTQIDAEPKRKRPRNPGHDARMKKRQIERKLKNQRSEDIWISNSSNHSDDDDVGGYGASSKEVATSKKQQVRRPETNRKKKQQRKTTAKSATPPEETTSAEFDPRGDLPYETTEEFSRLHYDVERGTAMEYDYDKSRYSYVMPETEKKRKEKRLSERTNKGSKHSKSTRKTVVIDFNNDEEDPSFRHSERHSGHNTTNHSRGSVLTSSYFYDLYRGDIDGPSFRRTTMDLADTSLRNTSCCLVSAGIFFICTTVGFTVLLTKLLNRDE